jgi:hypothetical protein
MYVVKQTTPPACQPASPHWAATRVLSVAKPADGNLGVAYEFPYAWHLILEI